MTKLFAGWLNEALYKMHIGLCALEFKSPFLTGAVKSDERTRLCAVFALWHWAVIDRFLSTIRLGVNSHRQSLTLSLISVIHPHTHTRIMKMNTLTLSSLRGGVCWIAHKHSPIALDGWRGTGMCLSSSMDLLSQALVKISWILFIYFYSRYSILYFLPYSPPCWYFLASTGYLLTLLFTFHSFSHLTSILSSFIFFFTSFFQFFQPIPIILLHLVFFYLHVSFHSTTRTCRYHFAFIVFPPTPVSFSPAAWMWRWRAMALAWAQAAWTAGTSPAGTTGKTGVPASRSSVTRSLSSSQHCASRYCCSAWRETHWPSWWCGGAHRWGAPHTSTWAAWPCPTLLSFCLCH